MPVTETKLKALFADQDSSMLVNDVEYLYYGSLIRGGLAERSKAAVLKTVDLNGSAGSNPVSSAIIEIRRRGRAVEGSTLLRCRTGNRTVSSNLTVSAIFELFLCDKHLKLRRFLKL
jgi:hypothetical protein